MQSFDGGSAIGKSGTHMFYWFQLGNSKSSPIYQNSNKTTFLLAHTQTSLEAGGIPKDQVRL